MALASLGMQGGGLICSMPRPVTASIYINIGAVSAVLHTCWDSDPMCQYRWHVPINHVKKHVLLGRLANFHYGYSSGSQAKLIFWRLGSGSVIVVTEAVFVI
jgi:hypothetical protein